jgi:hypothetical protein
MHFFALFQTLMEFAAAEVKQKPDAITPKSIALKACGPAKIPIIKGAIMASNFPNTQKPCARFYLLIAHKKKRQACAEQQA